MMGRRGMDQLSFALFIAYLVLMLLSRILLLCRLGVLAVILDVIGFAGVVFGVYRTLSRNIPARDRENAWFLQNSAAVRRFFSRRARHFRDRKTHVYVKCSSCGAELRVPRGKGKLIVTCPKCRSEIRVTT